MAETKQEVKHTALPWKVSVAEVRSNWPGRGFSQQIVTTTDVPITVHGDTKEEAQANTELIVRAVNAYDELVGKLEFIASWLTRHLETNAIHRSTGKGGHDGDGNSWGAAAIPDWDVRQRVDEIQAALQAAKQTC